MKMRDLSFSLIKYSSMELLTTSRIIINGTLMRIILFRVFLNISEMDITCGVNC